LVIMVLGLAASLSSSQQFSHTRIFISFSLGNKRTLSRRTTVRQRSQVLVLRMSMFHSFLLEALSINEYLNIAGVEIIYEKRVNCKSLGRYFIYKEKQLMYQTSEENHIFNA